MKILFLAHLFPLPLDSGGKIKSYYTLKTLASKYELHLLAFTRNEDEIKLIPEIENFCKTVTTVRLSRTPVRQAADLTRSLITNKSFIVTRDFRRDMQSSFRQAVNNIQPDAVHIDHLQMAQYIDWEQPFKTVLDHHNVESEIIKRIAETSTRFHMRKYAAIEWPKLRKYELDICKRCDLVLTVSNEDAATLKSLGAPENNVHCVPIGVDIEYFSNHRRDPNSKNILSVATMHWPPNIDSVLYFHSEILPIIRKKMPDVTFTIAGQKPAPEVLALASDPLIRVTGYVDDVRKASVDCGVFVVPLRSGSGVRVKILNALAMGLPVVSTSIGAEGLEVKSGEHLIIADDPQSFASAVIDILNNPELADNLGEAGRKLVSEKYSWESVGRKLISIYENCINKANAK